MVVKIAHVGVCPYIVDCWTASTRSTDSNWKIKINININKQKA